MIDKSQQKLDKYLVTIGSDFFEVEAVDHQDAKYTAADLFRQKYNLNIPLSPIVQYAKSRTIKGPAEPTISTQELLQLLQQPSRSPTKLTRED